MRIVPAASYRVMPWKNGGGTTTEIAVSPDGAGMDAFDWRVSMAHVGSDGPFSSFSGIDRTLSVLAGAGLVLAFGDGEHVTLDRASAPFAFAADRPVEGLLVDGAIDDLNVMSRRGRWRHAVTRRHGGERHEIAFDDGVLILVAQEGAWDVSGTMLASGDSAVVDGPARLSVTGAAGATLYVIQLSPEA